MAKTPDAFFSQALELRERAFDSPLIRGRRTAIGPLSWGARIAMWEADTAVPGMESTDAVSLMDGGLRLGGMPIPLFGIDATQLRTDDYTSKISKIYEIDFAFRKLVVSVRATTDIREELKKPAEVAWLRELRVLRQERKAGVVPTDEDRWFVLRELERGATGLHHINVSGGIS